VLLEVRLERAVGCTRGDGGVRAHPEL
jgi:hypothetical protein